VLRDWLVFALLPLLLVRVISCSGRAQQREGEAMNQDRLDRLRNRMVEEQIVARGVKDERVLAAMRKVPRHLFVPENLIPEAYDDTPLPIGHGQTISQPYIVALMTELLQLSGDEKVLEVGTGSGYQAAILGELAKEVYTIEIVEPLAKQAAERLRELGYTNVHVRHGDGYDGWPEQAPFDGIIVTAAPERIPKPLLDQLKPGGRLVIPVGAWSQDLLVVSKSPDGKITRRVVIPVRFVPMTGKAERLH